MNVEGGINVRFLPAVLNAVGMNGHIWQGPPANPPDIAFIEEKLHISYLLAVYPVPGGSHFVIIYGVDATHVHYFNPWQAVGATRATHDQIRSTRMILGWKPP